MLPFTHLRSPALRRNGDPSSSTLRLLTSKPAKVIVSVFVAVVSALALVHFFLLPRLPASSVPDIFKTLQAVPSAPVPPGKGRLHLLIPATSSNSDLCKLLLSAQILGYPTPVLINYGDHESEDAYVQHLGKVEGILNYLEQLEESDEYDEDLVLIIDGFDIWFQLRPDILIKRFYAANDAANARAVELYGQEIVERYDMHQTVIFGPDKLCWPVDYSRPACWAVPETPLSQTAFGPKVEYEDREKNEFRWLNSGTVMGSAPDLREIFRATLEEIHTNHTTDSDQFYFANVFGLQEYARVSRNPTLLEHLKNRTYIDLEDPHSGQRVRYEPEITDDMKTEFHIGLDYTSTLFQTLAFWRQHLTWTREIDSWKPPNSSQVPHNPREIQLPEDIRQSAPPFEPFKYGFDVRGHAEWPEVELVHNVITKEFPVVLHITGSPYEKTYRAWWWSRLWFQPEAERLRLASLKLDQRAISTEPIGGMLWFNAEMDDAEDIVGGGKGGVFTDRRGWLSWGKMCKGAEEEMYRRHEDEYFHPEPED